MKLSEFNNKPIIKPKSTRTVFTLSNEAREKALQSQIEELEATIEQLNSELRSLGPYPEMWEGQNSELRKRQAALDQQIETIQSLESQLDLAKTKNSEIESLKQEISTYKSEKNQLQSQNSLFQQENDAFKQENDDLTTNLSDFRQLVDTQSEVITGLNTEKTANINQLEALKTINIDLRDELIPLQTDYPLLRSENQENKYQLGVALAKNKDAIQRIDELEYLKQQLTKWTNDLNDDIKETDSKKSAYERSMKKKDKVVAELTQELSELLEDREELLELVQYYRAEASKPRYNGSLTSMREIDLPFAGEAVRRQYIGMGKPTMLKFKREESNDHKK